MINLFIFCVTRTAEQRHTTFESNGAKNLKEVDVIKIKIKRFQEDAIIPKYAKKSDRIAQGVVKKVEDASFIEVESLTESERGEGGLGHSGIK